MSASGFFVAPVLAKPSLGSSGAALRVPGGVARRPALTRLPLPRVLLCDLDGTLIDSMPTLAEIAAEVMEEVYATPASLSRELYLATCGLPFAEIGRAHV